MNMNSDRGMLQNAVNRQFVPVYATSFAEVKDYLQDKYGQSKWIGKLAEALAGRQAGVKAKDDKPYLAARRSIERYEKGQFKDMKKYSPEMAKVGKQLPPIGKTLPGNKLTLTVKGEQSEGSGTREREFSATLTGADAYAFADAPSYRAFLKSLGYPDRVIDLFEAGEYEITVTFVA